MPFEAATGAAMAVIAGQAFAFCVALFIGRRIFPLPLPIASATRVLACCAFMALSVMAVPGETPACFLLQIIAGVLSYTAAAFALNVLNIRTYARTFLTRLVWRSS